MKNKIVYIGNKLSGHGVVPTSVETLGKQLSDYYDVVSASDKLNKIARLMDMLWTVWKERRGTKCVIIDTYSTSNFYFAFAAAQLCRVLKLEYIPILHGGNLPERLDRCKCLSKMLFGNSYINVAPSGYLKYEFERRGYSTELISNNIDIKDYEFESRESFCPRLLWVRSFVGLYNPEMAVRVLEVLKAKYPESKLCMLGPDKDGSMVSTIALAHEFGLTVSTDINEEADFIVPGRMGKREWHQLSKQYDIFINTTNFDNTPVSVIEGMALGLPVISTNVGGVPYLIDDGVDGILVNKDDVEAMSEAVESLVIGDADGKAIALTARKKVEFFDWEVIKIQWMNLIDGI